MQARGRIHEALTLFQAATCLNPQNVCNVKQVGRCLSLLGKHKAALDVFEEANKVRRAWLSFKTNMVASDASMLHCVQSRDRHKNHAETSAKTKNLSLIHI